MLLPLHLRPSIRPAPRTLSNTSGCCAISPSRLWRSAPARREHPRGNQARQLFSSTAQPTAQPNGLPPYVEPCVPAVMPLAAFSVASTAPSGKPPPDAFGNHHDVRFNPCPFMRKQLACATRHRIVPRPESSRIPCSSHRSRRPFRH